MNNVGQMLMLAIAATLIGFATCIVVGALGYFFINDFSLMLADTTGGYPFGFNRVEFIIFLIAFVVTTTTFLILIKKAK